MEKRKPDFREALTEMVHGARPADVPTLEGETLAAYLRGDLGPEEEKRVRACLVRSPEAVERLLWLARKELPDAAEATVSEHELRAGWRGLRRRLRAAGAWRTPALLRPAVAAPALAASILLALAASVAWLVDSRVDGRRIAELERRLGEAPAVSEPAWTADAGTPILYPERPTRGREAAAVRVPEGAEVFVLVLDVSGYELPSFAVSVVDPRGEPVWESAARSPNEFSNLVVTLGRRLLPGDRYLLRLHGPGGSSTGPLEEVAIELGAPPGGGG